MSYDVHAYRFSSRRNIIFSKNGAVATSHPLAAQVGLDVLQKGGNAVDAAIASAAALAVFEPTSNGIGGDAFAIICMKGKLYGINGSGRSPERLSYEYLREKNINRVPKLGWLPVTVPGIPRTWAQMHKRFGRLKFPELFSETIEYCREGYPVSPAVSRSWHHYFYKISDYICKPCFRPWFDTFTINGRPPGPGEIVRFPCHAETLEKIGQTYAEDFYVGEIADDIVNFSNITSGFLSKDDLENFSPEWTDPVSASYGDYEIFEMPPNTQGIITLIALKILIKLKEEGKYQDDQDSLHYEIESLKSSFQSANGYIADREHMQITSEQMLDDRAIDALASSILPDSALCIPDLPSRAGTVYIACHDIHGNMVSYIQSNYGGFGSGIVIPRTGIALHNRGNNFNMILHHPNCIDAGKKPYHTIMPGFIMKKGIPLGPFGVMGAFMQPQGHLQVLLNLIDKGMNPQEALDAPRWNWLGKNRVIFEQEFDKTLIDNLRIKNHDAEISCNYSLFGRGQVMWRYSENVFCSGTEKRCDGHIASF